MNSGPAASPENRSISLLRPLVVFDLETTGKIVGVDRIVEFAAIKLWPNGERTHHEWRINPEIPIPEEATRIHGIRDEDVRDKPTFREMLPEIREVFRDSDVAGFNVARFDMPMLQSELERANVKALSTRHVVDAMVIYHAMEPRNLSAAVRYYCGKEFNNAHSALPDVSATVEVLLAQLMKYPELPTTVEGLSAIGARTADQHDVSGGWFVKRGNTFFFAKGKYRGKAVDVVARSARGYLEWMNNSLDLPADAARCVQEALREVERQSSETDTEG